MFLNFTVFLNNGQSNIPIFCVHLSHSPHIDTRLAYTFPFVLHKIAVIDEPALGVSGKKLVYGHHLIHEAIFSLRELRALRGSTYSFQTDLL